MSRCIIVSGLPLLPRTARPFIVQHLDPVIRKGLAGLRQTTSDKIYPGDSCGKRTRPFKIEVAINHHQRLGEIVKVIFAEDVEVEVVSALCASLQESSATTPIRVRKTAKDVNNNTPPSNPQPSLDFVATFSLGAGSIRDHAFPSWPWALRRRIQCDGVGAFSLTHESAANRTAKLLRCFLDGQNGNLLVDGFAGVGGNTFGFLKYWKDVTAVEIHPQRYSMLRANVELWKDWQDERLSSRNVDVQNMCIIDFIARNDLPRSSVLFLDPPWGGPQYQRQIEEQGHDITIQPNSDFPNIKHSTALVVDCSVPWRFSQAACKLIETNKFQILAMKLPNGFEDALIVDPLVHSSNHVGMERTHPFRFHFGSHTKLIVLVRNNGDDPKFANGPAGLDLMIQRIMSWHNSLELQSDDGCREHRPEFYDWEKCRWIMLKKWKGSKTTT